MNRNPKKTLYKNLFLGFLISLLFAFLSYLNNWIINNSGIQILLSLTAIIFFVFTLFVQSKLTDDSFNYINEITSDKLLTIGLYLFIINLIFNTLIAIIDTNIIEQINIFLNLNNVLQLNKIFSSLYIFSILFSIHFVFFTYIFIIQLINPVKLATYLISRVNFRRIIAYELCIIYTNSKGKIIIKRNIYSVPIRYEDPLIPFHEATLIPIKKYDYRSIGNILYQVLNKGLKSSILINENNRLKYSYHLFDYVVSLQKNLTNPDIYNWQSKLFIPHFIYIYILVIKKHQRKKIKKNLQLLKASLLFIIYHYFSNFKENFVNFNFKEHIILIDEIDPNRKDVQLQGIRKILNLRSKNYLKIFNTHSKIKDISHPWEINIKAHNNAYKSLGDK